MLGLKLVYLGQIGFCAMFNFVQFWVSVVEFNKFGLSLVGFKGRVCKGRGPFWCLNCWFLPWVQLGAFWIAIRIPLVSQKKIKKVNFNFVDNVNFEARAGVLPVCPLYCVHLINLCVELMVRLLVNIILCLSECLIVQFLVCLAA